MKNKYIMLIMLVFLSGCSWSKLEIGYGIASCFATGTDAYTTMRMLDNPDNHERNPILGKHPSDAEIIIYMASSQILALTVAHFVPEWRKLILGSKTAINLGASLNNVRLDWNE